MPISLRSFEHFDFIPSWRIDDIMVSYAADRGSVGAHVDNYDVFLLQALGGRRWRISTDAKAPKEFRTDAELKLLKRFTATHDWVLQPGDMLYLPPGVPHHGVADGECMTFSIGMRAPAVAEMLIDLADTLAGSLNADQRYADPELAPAGHHGVIDPAAFKRVATALKLLRAVDADRLGQWFGGFITRYRAAHDAVPRRVPLSATRVRTRLRDCDLVRNPWSRFAYYQRARQAQLFVAGDAHPCSQPLAELLCARRVVSGAGLLALAGRGQMLALLTELINAGHLHLRKCR